MVVVAVIAAVLVVGWLRTFGVELAYLHLLHAAVGGALGIGGSCTILSRPY